MANVYSPHTTGVRYARREPHDHHPPSPPPGRSLAKPSPHVGPSALLRRLLVGGGPPVAGAPCRYDELDVMEHYVILQRMAAERFAEAKAA
jgi:hypothetical protein